MDGTPGHDDMPGQPAPSRGESLWAHAEGSISEDVILAGARERATDIGAGAVTPAVGALLCLLAKLSGGKAVAEVGTGAGVSGLWLLSGMRDDGVLTTIDIEPEHLRLARQAFAEAGIGPSRTRLISGRAQEVLTRLADASYDLVFIDADPIDQPDYVAESVRLALAGEFVPDAVNVGGGVVNEEVAPWLDLVRKLGVLAGVLSDELPVSLSVQVRGELAAEEVEVLRLSALRGLFSAVIEDAVTFVNAPALAAERGVTAEICKASESPNHRSVVDVRAVGADGSVVTVSGTLYGPQLSQKIVQINGRHFDLRAQGINLIIHYVDRPGALGKIGTLLGTAGVNIQAAQLSEDAEGPGATILLRLDQDVPDDVRTAIAAAVDAYKLEVVDLS